jgi:hypothetical protein
MKLKFAKTTFLKLFRRPLLAGFLSRFTTELAAKELSLPAVELDDDAYYEGVAALARSPEGLPPTLFEALFAVEAMATQDGQQRLERAIEQSPLAGTFANDSTHAELALQAFTADPVLFARKLMEVKLTRLVKFEFYASKLPLDRRQTFTAPDAATLARMTSDMDAWFPDHNRGRQLTHIEVIEIDGEFVFIIRHGDTYARVPATGANRQIEVLHFRPLKEDVVVFDPERDELRIHAGTKGEIELYREVFGRRLFGDPRYFSERKAYTLAPLIDDGLDSVDPIRGIERVVLRETEWAWDNALHDVHAHGSDDLFASAAEHGPERKVIPPNARPVSATFEFYFTGSPTPRKVVIRPHNILKLGRHCDARLVHLFLGERRFRTTVNTPPPRGGITHVDGLAQP